MCGRQFVEIVDDEIEIVNFAGVDREAVGEGGVALSVAHVVSGEHEEEGLCRSIRRYIVEYRMS